MQFVERILFSFRTTVAPESSASFEPVLLILFLAALDLLAGVEQPIYHGFERWPRKLISVSFPWEAKFLTSAKYLIYYFCQLFCFSEQRNKVGDDFFDVCCVN